MKFTKMMTKEIANKIPPLYAQEKKGDDAIAYAKYFDPCSAWTWYATEYNPETQECFGLVVGHEVELGYFSLAELSKVRNRLGLPIERDLHFSPTTLREIRAEVRS